MSAQTPLRKDDPLMVAWEARKATEEHANDVRWAKVEAHTVGSLWSAFEAGWRARGAAIAGDDEVEKLRAAVKKLECTIREAAQAIERTADDVLWMPDDAYPAETVVDFLRTALGDTP